MSVRQSKPHARSVMYAAFVFGALLLAILPCHAQSPKWEVFNSLNSGLPHDMTEGIAIGPHGYTWIATSGGLAVTDGIVWSVYDSVNSGLPTHDLSSITIDDDGTVWLGTGAEIDCDPCGGSGVIEFDGENWTVHDTTNSGLPTNSVLQILIDAGGNKWVATNPYGLARYDGVNWTAYDQDDVGIQAARMRVASLAEDAEGGIWIGLSHARVARFDGSDWTVHRGPDPGYFGYMSGHLIDAQGEHWFGTSLATNTSLIHYDGVTWTVLEHAVLPTVWASVIDGRGNKWFGGAALGELDGDNWTTYTHDNSDLPGRYGLPARGVVRGLAVDAHDNLWIATTVGGVAVYREGGVILGVPTAVEESCGAAIPDATSLAQNYPNPFNSSTTIRFDLPQSQEIEMTIYSLAGQEAATLASGHREAGTFTLHWDGRDDDGQELASGVYLYRLQAGERVETRKLLLLR